MKFTNKSEGGSNSYNQFSADFSDDFVRLNKKDYPLGTICRMVANISKDDMTTLLQYGGRAKQIYEKIFSLGYSRELFIEQKKIVEDMLAYMKTLEVFQCFDFQESERLLNNLFSSDALDRYDELNQINEPFPEGLRERTESLARLFAYAKVFSLAYAYIAIDTANFATAIQNYTNQLMEANSRQKEQLAKTAFELFNDEVFMYYLHMSSPAEKTMRGFSVNSIQTVVPVIDNADGNYKIFRRVFFGRMMDFYVMDFFEALSRGHYLWQCKICGRYFLMTSAHRQLYCDDVNPEYNVPCKYIAKHPEITKKKMPSQKKTDTPIQLLWKRRDNAI